MSEKYTIKTRDLAAVILIAAVFIFIWIKFQPGQPITDKAARAYKGSEPCCANGFLVTYGPIILSAATFFVLVWQGFTYRLQSHIQERQLLATTRPQIRIRHLWLPEVIASGERMSVQIVLANVGNGPAQLTKVSLDANFIMRGERLPGRMDAREQVVPLPVLGLGMPYAILVPEFTVPIPPEKMRSIIAGHEDIVCFGSIEYTDADAPPDRVKIRKTAFRRVLVLTPAYGAGTGRFDIPETPDRDYEYED